MHNDAIIARQSPAVGSDAAGKFRDPALTRDGETRARVRLRALETLWFNTGTLCNLTCANCYIESSPSNDRLSFLSRAEVAAFLREIRRDALPVREIGFTGGEPFMNPEFPDMLRDALEAGHRALVLTNAMRPMQKCADQMLALRERFGDRMTLRVSVDHYRREVHQQERGRGSWLPTLRGLRWLSGNGFAVHVAGRTCWSETEESLRAGFRNLFETEGIPVDAHDPARLVLFPEMDAAADVPEITTACWDILGVDPDSMMCASSRMVVKRRGAAAPVVLACTLIPDDSQFELGSTLAESLGSVALNHPHCARFCVLGGGSCSA